MTATFCASCRAPPRFAGCSGPSKNRVSIAKCASLPLYGDLEGAAQDAALRPAPAGQRKIVLATSIAETSLTIEGIRVVVDSGLRRYAEFDPATGMSRLVTTKVSQAAADQRRGRAGRLSAGHCYRLWSEGTQASLAAANGAGNPARGSRALWRWNSACWGAVDAGQPALARSAARCAAGAGTRSAAAARGHRCRRPRHSAWQNTWRSLGRIRGSRICWSRRASTARRASPATSRPS